MRRSTCLVAYLAHSLDRRCSQPDWDAAVEQFSLLFFLWLLSDKRGAEISQALHQIVELISRIKGLLQSWSSNPLHVTSVCAESSNCLLFVEARLNRQQVSRHVKRHCQAAVEMNPEGPDWPTRCHSFVFVAKLHPKCHPECKKVASLSMLLPKAAERPRSFEIHKTQIDVARKSSVLYFLFSISHCMLALGDL